jgi:DNA-directed RNA polymerase alpha subunit
MVEANPFLRDLDLGPIALAELEAHGFYRLDDLRHLTNVQILTLPNVGGKSYRRILAALGR